jgi:cell division protein FtsB
MSSLNELDQLAKEKNGMYDRIKHLEEENNKLLTEIKTLKYELELLTVCLKGVLKTFEPNQIIEELLKKQ